MATEPMHRFALGINSNMFTDYDFICLSLLNNNFWLNQSIKIADPSDDVIYLDTRYRAVPARNNKFVYDFIRDNALEPNKFNMKAFDAIMKDDDALTTVMETFHFGDSACEN